MSRFALALRFESIRGSRDMNDSIGYRRARDL